MKGEQIASGFEPAEPMEIERKFLVTELDPGILPEEGTPITQGYVRIRGTTETRVRHKGEQHCLTVKSGAGLQRSERETAISEKTYSDILPLTQGRRIEKVRYEIPHDGNTLEVDVYGGDLAGLVVAETEFSGLQEAGLFLPPAWMSEEVTEDGRYKNQQLALNGMPGEHLLPAEVQEVSLEKGLRALNKYAATLRDTLGRPIIVAIAGGSASGKTTAVASQLAEHFGEQALMLSLDDYYKGVKFMYRRGQEIGRELSFDEPEVVDMALAAEHLQALRDGETIEKPIYDFESGERSGIQTMRLGNRSVIIVEGLFALDDEIAETADITSFVNIETHGRVMRRLLRDVVRTSWTPNRILGYFETLEKKYQQYVEPTKSNADIVINNGYKPDIEAKRSEQYEVQLKYRAGLIEEEDLRKLGAELIAASVTQTDRYYNPRGADLADSDELIRLRKTNDAITFGYKGPRAASTSIRQRPKIEFPIDEATMKSLEYIYPDTVKQVTKERRMFLLDGVVITLDDVETEDAAGNHRRLGKFLELRSDSSDQIVAVSQHLQLDPQEADARAYFDM